MQPSNRIQSLDQFRGYTVMGMFFVNFLGDYASHYPALFQLKHHNTFFSYADSIMPQFFFAVGFAFRLTILKRLATIGAWAASRQVILRGLGLVLLSLILFPPHKEFKSWADLQQVGAAKLISDVIKCDLWETLALIGVTSILVLPVMARSFGVRLLTLIGFAAIHVAIAQSFNFHSVAGKPNLLDSLWPLAAGKSSFDGGPFGILMWAMPMLAGSLAYDIVASNIKTAFWKLACLAILAMSLGYLASCGTMLYTLDKEGQPWTAKTISDSPVIPLSPNLENRDYRSLLAEPPFFPPKETPVRAQNYWTMCKRHVTLSFMLFATGFAFAVYSVFLIISDFLSIRIPLFTTFGQNALAGYVIHEMVMHAVKPYVPRDSPVAWLTIGFCFFFFVTWLFVSHLERNRIFLKL